MSNRKAIFDLVTGVDMTYPIDPRFVPDNGMLWAIRYHYFTHGCEDIYYGLGVVEEAVGEAKTLEYIEGVYTVTDMREFLTEMRRTFGLLDAVRDGLADVLDNLSDVNEEPVPDYAVRAQALYMAAGVN